MLETTRNYEIDLSFFGCQAYSNIIGSAKGVKMFYSFELELVLPTRMWKK